MAMTYVIDRDARIVVGRPYGALTFEDLFAYHAGVWSHPDVVGFDELIDLREVEEFVFDSRERLREFAQRTVEGDLVAGPGRIAIVAVEDLHFGFARMFELLRDGKTGGLREVRVFRDADEAYAWVSQRDASPHLSP